MSATIAAMARDSTDLEGEVGQTLDREMRIIRDAVLLVATGGAPRVVLAGLRLSDQLLEPARRYAASRGVRALPLWRADEEGLDIAVERYGHDVAPTRRSQRRGRRTSAVDSRSVSGGGG